MSSTVIQTTNENVITYHEGAWTMTFVNKTMRFSACNPTKGEMDLLPKGTKSMISANKKILVSLNIGLYNFYYDCLNLILRANKIAPDATIILDVTGISTDLEKPYFKFVLKLLDDLDINYELFDPSDLNAIYINDFYTLSQQQVSFEDVEYLYGIVQKYIHNTELKPFRNIYVSRKNVERRDYPKQKPGLMFNGDNRILDEDALEDYLVSLGFEVVYPEDFDDFVDQINYFYEAKTIISATSSGMTNAIFMQPGGTMIELMTPLVLALGNPYGEDDIDAQDILHHLYQIIAYNKRHTYIGIPNHGRESKTIKETIQDNEYLSKIIEDKV